MYASERCPPHGERISTIGQWTVADPGERHGGAPPLFLDQTEAGKLFRWPPPPLLLIWKSGSVLVIALPSARWVSSSISLGACFGEVTVSWRKASAFEWADVLYRNRTSSCVQGNTWPKRPVERSYLFAWYLQIWPLQTPGQSSLTSQRKIQTRT